MSHKFFDLIEANNGVKGHLIGNPKEGTVIGSYATAEGYLNEASGDYSHAEGQGTQATGKAAHSEGYKTQAIGINSHAEGDSTRTASDA